VKWLGLAAAQGIAQAQANLGVMYELGDGVPKNSPEAVKWYHQAARQGIARAQRNLGNLFARGAEGVPKDAVEGLAWSIIAAASGDELFVQSRNLIERRMGNQAILAAQKRSQEIQKEIDATKP